MPDRGGGKETKGTSVKGTKKSPGGVGARGMKKKYVLSPESKSNLPPPAPRSGRFFDCSVGILSRQFDRDRDRALSRAVTDGVSGILGWFSDVEKLEDLASLCTANSGLCYYTAGVHPDNIDRTNKKLHENWMLKVDDFARNAECIALLSGLNLNRDVGTHFAQESLLRASYKLAKSLSLPLVLHTRDPRSLHRAIEVLLEEGYTKDHSILLHDFLTCANQDMSIIEATLVHDFYYCLAAHPLLYAGVDHGALTQLPLTRLLLCSNAPWNTPQNIEDAHVRSQRNEPSNISYVVDILFDTLVMPRPTQTSKDDFTRQLHTNAIEVFQLSGGSPRRDVKANESNAVPMKIRTKSTDISQLPDAVSNITSESPAAGYYVCNKCRTKLFSADILMPHDTVATFNKGVDCNAVLYISSEHSVSAFQLHNETINCGKCQAKIGKFSFREMQCPPYRVTASKVDYKD